MKKILLISLLAIASCSGDDDNNTCSCVGEWGNSESVEYTMETGYNCATGEATYNPTGDPNGLSWAARTKQ